MARFCKICNKKLSFFYRKPICKHCISTKYDMWLVDQKILELPNRSDDDITQLTTFGVEKILPLYYKLLEEYISDNLMTEDEIIALERVSRLLKLTPQQSKHDEIILPHKVKNYINENNELPTVNEDSFKQMNMRLSDDEEYFCSGSCDLYELGKQSEYVRGSRGVSIFGVSGIGRVQGQRVSHTVQRLKSKGDFVMTNKRFYYMPNAYGSVIKLDILKIVKYDYDDEFLIIYKSGRQKPHLFFMSIGMIKVCKIGIDFIVNVQ